jgi:N-methylhydantoinase A
VFLSGGVDIGGTFTDCVLIGQDGRVYAGKSPTTREDLTQGFLAAIEVAAAKAGADAAAALASLQWLAHGTTVATNIMVQRSGASTALITTRGHGDAIFLQRAAGRVAGLPRTELLDLMVGVKPEPLVPHSLVFEVDERADVDGKVLVELDREGMRAAVRAAREQGAVAIAVAFLWSFANPANERAAREILEREAEGELFISVSHEVAPSWGEYERTMSTVINSYVGPETASYIDRVEGELRRRGFGGAFAVMKSDGGVATAREAAQRPVTLLSSGPAGALAATQRMLEALGERDAITTDMGGTSLDIGILVGGRPLTVDSSVVDRFEFHLPTLDIVSVGSGGGSIAWIDELSGALKVGPRSAGAQPGPAAYGNGGQEPTVADANVVLGYLNPDYFLGGALKLDRELAESAVARLAQQLGLSTLQTAAGIRTIVDAQMSDAIRMLTVARGYDPRNFTLLSFGGAGPTHAADYARELGARRVLVPFADVSSLWSAMGVALADVVHVEEASVMLSEPFDATVLQAALTRLRTSAMERVQRERIAEQDIELEIVAKVKYALQVHAIDVPLPDAERPDSEALVTRFHERYAELYGPGAGYREAGVEIIGLRCTATGRREREMRLPRPASAPRSVGEPRSRPVYWTHHRAMLDTPVLREGDLGPGWSTAGPAVIELPDTTVLVPPDFSASLDELGSICLERVAPETSGGLGAGARDGLASEAGKGGRDDLAVEGSRA